MQQYIQTITRHFFKKDDLEQVAVEDLEEFIASYPYSSAGHLLLARKLSGLEPSAFSRQAAVTSLYFSNPLWLHRVLGPSSAAGNANEDGFFSPADEQFSNDDLPTPSAPFQDQSFPVEETSDEPILDEEAPQVFSYKDTGTVSSAMTQETGPAKELATNNNFFSAGNIAEEQKTEAQERLSEEKIVSEHPETPNAESRLAEEQSPEQHEANVSGSFVSEPSIEHHETAVHNNSFTAEPAAEQRETPASNSFFAEENIPEHLMDTGTENTATAETINEPFASIDQPQPALEPEVTTHPAEAEPGSTAATNNDQRSDAGLTIPAPNMNEQPDLTFQSYHTVDYFASQGIKLRQEDLMKDRFGQQVKSFTEWLRNMKRLAAPPMVEEEDASTASVRESAAHSFNEKDVITETMAEVWIKQENFEKAIVVYEKLSLLNPSKNAYFAAKIEQLKARL